MSEQKPHDVVRPIPDSYVVPGTRLVAGEYPGSPPGTTAALVDAKLSAFLDAGISAFVDLTDPDDGLEPYEPVLRALASGRGMELHYQQLTIRDMRVCDTEHMRRVLDTIEQHLAAGRTVYAHCWGGIGRTGMVVGCWMVRRGRSPEDALGEVDRLFRSMSPAKVRAHRSWGSPETEAQRDFVRAWRAHDGGPAPR